MSNVGYGSNLAIGYGSKRLGVRRPPIVASIISLGAGGLLLILSIVSLLLTIRFVNTTYATYETMFQGNRTPQLEDTFFLIGFLAFAVIYGPMLLWAFIGGLIMIGKSTRELLQPWRPANVPADFNNYEDVIRAFKERVISHYRQYLRSLGGSLLGPNTLFLTPTSRMVVTGLGNSLSGHITWLVLALISFGCVIGSYAYLTSESGYQIMREVPAELRLMLEDGRMQLFIPLIVILVLHIVMAAIEVVAIFMLMPHGQPNTVAHEGTEHYRGFGHPAQMFARLPDLSIPLRWNDFLNRITPPQGQQWEETPSKSVGDVGGFTGRVIIEQQPQPILTTGRIAGYMLFIAGWLFILTGFAIYLFILALPLVQMQAVLLTPVVIFLVSLIGSTAALGGNSLRKHGQQMLDVAHFRSNAILIEFIGSLSRADVRVGKAMVDSIESSNVTVRSDFTARFWAAELISETPSLPNMYPLTARREILSLNQTDEAAYWLQFFRTEINKLRSEGVKPVGVDLVSDEVQNLVNANVGVSALRSGAMEKAQLQAAHESPPPLLQEQYGATPFPPGSAATLVDKSCPHCGQMVKGVAKFCRFCGYRFEA